MTRHAYLPTILITHRGSNFISSVIHEMTDVLDITLIHATAKYGQTIAGLQRTHATIKTSLKLSSGEFCKQWQKYLPLAILYYNKTYHKSFESEPD